MHDRSALGPADVSTDVLTAMVASALDADPARTELLSSSAETFPYDLQAITTAGRYWVHGEALVGGERRPWRIFVKHVQSWARSPMFALVPPEARAVAEASVPWRTEVEVYRSDLGERLPEGLRMPRPLGVFDLDERSAAVWLEEVRVRPHPWDAATYARAAFALGRLAASERVSGLARVGGHDFTVRTYLEGRLRMQVLPMLHAAEIWAHPLVAETFGDELRGRLVAAADSAATLVDELMELPQTTSHGDACPNNLLLAEGVDGFVLVDYGFWGPQPVGFDLSQLLVGDVQIGRRGVDDLQQVEDAIVPAYLAGLRAEGCLVREVVVRRAHALLLLIHTGLSAVPFELLDAPLTPEVRRIAGQRAAIVRFILDLVAATPPVR